MLVKEFMSPAVLLLLSIVASHTCTAKNCGAMGTCQYGYQKKRAIIPNVDEAKIYVVKLFVTSKRT
ncbi:hypothetical protein BH11BAC6_BH11BAC6_09080 [soil metagenome]